MVNWGVHVFCWVPYVARAAVGIGWARGGIVLEVLYSYHGMKSQVSILLYSTEAKHLLFSLLTLTIQRYAFFFQFIILNILSSYSHLALTPSNWEYHMYEDLESFGVTHSFHVFIFFIKEWEDEASTSPRASNALNYALSRQVYMNLKTTVTRIYHSAFRHSAKPLPCFLNSETRAFSMLLIASLM
jgi:hypothetical protein